MSHLSNLPPGVRECDLPGNSAADAAAECLLDEIHEVLAELGLDYADLNREDEKWLDAAIKDISDGEGYEMDYETGHIYSPARSIAERVIGRWNERADGRALACVDEAQSRAHEQLFGRKP